MLVQGCDLRRFKMYLAENISWTEGERFGDVNFIRIIWTHNFHIIKFKVHLIQQLSNIFKDLIIFIFWFKKNSDNSALCSPNKNYQKE